MIVVNVEVSRYRIRSMRSSKLFLNVKNVKTLFENSLINAADRVITRKTHFVCGTRALTALCPLSFLCVS